MTTPRFRSLEAAVPVLTVEAMARTLFDEKAASYFRAWGLSIAKPPVSLWEKAVAAGAFQRFLGASMLVELTPAERRALELARYEQKGRIEPLIHAVLDVEDGEDDEKETVEGKLWQKALPEAWCFDPKVFVEGCLWMDAIAPLMALADALYSVEALLCLPFEPNEERRRLAYFLPIPPDDPNSPVPDEDSLFLVGHFSWMAWIRDFAPEGAWWKEPVTYLPPNPPLDAAMRKALQGRFSEMTPGEVSLCAALLKGDA